MKIHVTICQSTLYEKDQKSAFFRPSDPFVTNTPHFLGSKFEYSLTKFVLSLVKMNHIRGMKKSLQSRRALQGFILDKLSLSQYRFRDRVNH